MHRFSPALLLALSLLLLPLALRGQGTNTPQVSKPSTGEAQKPLTKPAEAADSPPSTVKKSIPYVSDGHER
ncbi:MAG TPA: hypothetical protein PLA50_13675, partial [Bacteroidia bacterium]|nr:hypothetical protein [Bacteroidia bacterium]